MDGSSKVVAAAVAVAAAEGEAVMLGYLDVLLVLVW